LFHRLNLIFLCATIVAPVWLGFLAGPAFGETALPSLAPITIAQTVTPSLYPTDITPVNIGREQELFRPGRTFYFMQKLPSRLWFNAAAETSQRYESNVFLTKDHGRSDYVYRILPNITLGYNIAKHTSLYTNYFVIKDLFAGRSKLSFPTNQSLSIGIRHEVTLGTRSNLQFDFQARELWQLPHLRQFDFLPGITYTRVLTPSSVIFGNVILQLRGKNYFDAPTREIDPFYTIGYLRSYRSWVFSSAATLVTNYRHPPFNDAIPPFSNNAMVCDFEVSHPVTRKLPSLVAFARAEPIWNWSSKGFPGISGYDFRFFTGLRMTIVKPSFYSQMAKLHQQLKDVERLSPSQSNQQKAPTPGVQQTPDPNNSPQTPAPNKSQQLPATPNTSNQTEPQRITPESSDPAATASTSLPSQPLPEAPPVTSSIPPDVIDAVQSAPLHITSTQTAPTK
jgi:hypothetical protein